MEHVRCRSRDLPLHRVTIVPSTRALYRDACLFVVPGSHTLPRSADQRARSSTMDPPKDPLDMSGAIRVTLNRT